MICDISLHQIDVKLVCRVSQSILTYRPGHVPSAPLCADGISRQSVVPTETPLTQSLMSAMQSELTSVQALPG